MATIPLEPHRTVQEGPQGPARRPLPGGRWHFQHGPIDLIIHLDGDARAVAIMVEALWQRFSTILADLVEELDLLRRPVQEALGVRGPVARRMVAACHEHLPAFITPMAAVAGAVADELMHDVCAAEGIRRACINNGGDIALHLAPGMHYVVGMISNIDCAMALADMPGTAYRRTAGSSRTLDSGLRRNDEGVHASALSRAGGGQSGTADSGFRGNDGGESRPGESRDPVHPGALRKTDAWGALDGTLRIDHRSIVRGVATSGWRGRSFSLGIADSVTVLARDAATADAAATMIANAVDIDDPAVRRAPADTLKDDSDLGDRLVTTEVGRLMPAARRTALDRGEAHARMLVQRARIAAAALVLQGEVRVVASEDSRST